MTTPLPPSFNFVSALSGNWSRKPSGLPVSALWLYKPSIWNPSPDERESQIRGLLEFFYRSLPPELVALYRAEAAGKPALEALRLFGDHLDDIIPSYMLSR